MSKTNFSFLQKHQPSLAGFGQQAEQYIYTDPQSAVIKLRCFAEIYVSFIFKELNIPNYGEKQFVDKLKNSFFQESVEKCILDKLHAIRIKGNNAAHGKGVSIDDALWLVKEAFFIGAWLDVTFHGNTVEELPKYIKPQPIKSEYEILENDKNRLKEYLNNQTEDLRKAKAELVEIEKVNEESQSKIEELNFKLDQAKIDAVKEVGQSVTNKYDFEVKETQKRIHMDDLFSQYDLTEGQSELIKELDLFLKSKEDKVFLLKGYAGTGKTFITKGLTEYFRAVGRSYMLAAPTGKAAKVIAEKTLSKAYTIHKSIYTFKDFIEYKTVGVDGSETYKRYAQLAVNDKSVDCVYIVDEASMISDIYQEEEFFRFGSGYLLKDFLEHANLDHNDHRKKIIFIGDNAQLPPVGMSFSPALDEKYLREKHNLKTICYELTDIVRQKIDSGVISNSMEIRESLGKNDFNKLIIDLNYPDVFDVQHKDLMATYLSSCDKKINGKSIIIAYSNADVAEFNQRVREQFFPDVSRITSGDKVMAVKNCYSNGLFISNGDFGLIKEIVGESETRNITLRNKNEETGDIKETIIPLTFCDVVIGFKTLDGESVFFQEKIVENLLYNKQRSLSSDENKALYVDFCIRNPQLKSWSLEFKEELMMDPYFNALRLKFGYAITCHKAQGSEWENVFVKCSSHQNQDSEDYFRWFYTAITRTENHLYLLDPPNLKIGSVLKRVLNPSSSNPIKIEEHKKSQLSDRVNLNDAEMNTFNIPMNDVFSLDILKRVNRLIHDSSIKIQDVNQGEYMEIYYFMYDNNTVRIDIHYTGKGKISNITAPNTTDSSDVILKAISPLIGAVIIPVVDNKETKIEFEEEFLNELYSRIVPLAKNKGIHINDVKSLDWKQRYTFIKLDEVAVFDIYYNGKNQFRKYSPIKNSCTSGLLINEIEELLTEGLA